MARLQPQTVATQPDDIWSRKGTLFPAVLVAILRQSRQKALIQLKNMAVPMFTHHKREDIGHLCPKLQVIPAARPLGRLMFIRAGPVYPMRLSCTQLVFLLLTS